MSKFAVGERVIVRVDGSRWNHKIGVIEEVRQNKPYGRSHYAVCIPEDVGTRWDNMLFPLFSEDELSTRPESSG